MSDFEIK